MKKTYRLTVLFPVEAADDPEARAKARMIMEMAGPLLLGQTVAAKLQEIYEDKPPRKVVL